MVLMAYVSGLISTPAAILGVVGGMWWWRHLRRAQSGSDPTYLDLTPLPPPTPPSPQAGAVVNRMRRRSVPGARRAVHGRRRR